MTQFWMPVIFQNVKATVNSLFQERHRLAAKAIMLELLNRTDRTSLNGRLGTFHFSRRELSAEVGCAEHVTKTVIARLEADKVLTQEPTHEGTRGSFCELATYIYSRPQTDPQSDPLKSHPQTDPPTDPEPAHVTEKTHPQSDPPKAGADSELGEIAPTKSPTVTEEPSAKSPTNPPANSPETRSIELRKEENRASAPDLFGREAETPPEDSTDDDKQSPVTKFIRWWCEEFKRVTDSGYMVVRGKDGKLVTDMLAVHELHRLEEYARTFMRTPDDFISKEAGITLGTFSMSINKLASLGKAPSREQGRIEAQEREIRQKIDELKLRKQAVAAEYSRKLAADKYWEGRQEEIHKKGAILNMGSEISTLENRLKELRK